MLDIDWDLCDFMGPKTTLQLMPEAVMPFVRNHSNINHPCPFTGSIDLVKLPMDKRYLRGFVLPSGQYRFEADIYDSQMNATLIRPIVYLTVSSHSLH